MEHVTIRDEGPVRIVALDRPEKGHAITKGMAEAVQAAMLEFDSSDQRVAVLTATGTRAFSYGADVTEPPELWRAIPTVGFRTDKPVIAAIEGWCVGGAIVLAMMCDLAVCGAGAKFYYPEAKIGLTGGMIAGLAARIPHKVAMEMMLLCRTVEAERAASVGLVNEVVPEGQALSTAIAWGQEMAGYAPLVLGTLKRIVVEDILPQGPSEQMALHAQRMAKVRQSEDLREGVAAFREKRKPQFQGR
ncbi:enoyl-CoA hydratase/isomerase family protein [Limobrevibacterium gyesilva]|uniref:Enoyl-CoA hydratase-related protein n=1 Tax=Limobrevibacterium gyesilva TaxID=2991712 RepID=A0AA42CFS5_9PROT|nr:enoyl-CoA hydratase-related protein [Limobrevibacterium gyesilva]MCW3473297.1 enoyl-CoA hydratase-related protein [Limobrevibacterium gyesilva]